LPRRAAADFSQGNSSEENTSLNNSGLPSYLDALEIEKNANSANNNPLHDNGIKNGRSEISNGNHVTESDVTIDGHSQSCISGNESHAFESTTGVTESFGTTDICNRTKLTVADRLKMFQSTSEDVSLGTGAEKGRGTRDNTSKCESEVFILKDKKDASHSAPFLKPERKITPPVIKNTEKEIQLQPKVSAKRIDTFFGKLKYFTLIP